MGREVGVGAGLGLVSVGCAEKLVSAQHGWSHLPDKQCLHSGNQRLKATVPGQIWPDAHFSATCEPRVV